MTTLRDAAQALLDAWDSMQIATDHADDGYALFESLRSALTLPDAGWEAGAEAMREEGRRAVREVAAAARLTLIHVAGSPGREAWARSEINNEERIQLARLAALPVPPATTAPEQPTPVVCSQCRDTIVSGPYAWMLDGRTLCVDCMPSPTLGDERIARIINGLVEAGGILMGHVQQIDFDPTASNVAREMWLESVALLNGDDGPRYFPPRAPSPKENDRAD